MLASPYIFKEQFSWQKHWPIHIIQLHWYHVMVPLRLGDLCAYDL